MPFSHKIAFITAALLSGFAPAHAEKLRDVTINFSYDPSELSTPDGARKTLKSLYKKAYIACESRLPGSGLVRQDRACVTNIMNQAIRRIQSPLLQRTFVDLYGARALTTADLSMD